MNLISPSLTVRNIIVILPPLAVVAAIATRQLNTRMIFILIGLSIFITPSSYQPLVPNGPYTEVANFVDTYYEEGGHIVIDTQPISQHATLIYYLRERTNHHFQQETMTHIGLYSERGAPVAQSPQNRVMEFDAIAPFLDSKPPQIFWIEVQDPGTLSDATLAAIEQDYVVHRSVRFNGVSGVWYHTITEYRRIPDELQTILTVDDNISLDAWNLSSFTVNQCGNIELESWWILDTVPTENYLMSFVLVDETGNGIVKADGKPADTDTMQWEAGRYYLDERSITIPCDLPSGSYPLLIDWYQYDEEQGYRKLNMLDGSGNIIDQLFYLTNVNVE